MFELLRARRMRRAAAQTIGPWVDRSRRRLGAIPDEKWRDPYMMGFLASLISVLAERATRGRVSDDALGMVQSEAWAEITGVRYLPFGEEVCLLSSNGDPAFRRGCSNALTFTRLVLDGSLDATADVAEAFAPQDFETVPIAPAAEDDFAVFGRGGATAAVLWEQYFERAIA